jgi:methylated-DNA-[protein]-cysteine S-methyltransferase
MKTDTTFVAHMNSPIGVLLLCFNSRIELIRAEFMEEGQSLATANGFGIKEIENAVTQFEEFFKGERTSFDIKVSPEGTEFQKKVWKQLQKIEFGRTVSYQQMANQLGDPKVIRAAASANGKNPISIIIPCHRVIGSDGSLTGYAGGLHRKKWLLEHESPVKQGILFE